MRYVSSVECRVSKHRYESFFLLSHHVKANSSILTSSETLKPAAPSASSLLFEGTQNMYIEISGIYI
jgi:hypothetical protein